MNQAQIAALYPLRRASYVGAVTKNDVVTLQKVLQSIATLSKNPALAFTLAPRWADGIVGQSTANAVNIAIRKPKGLAPASVAAVKKYVLEMTENGLAIVRQLQAQQRQVAQPIPPAIRQEQAAAAKAVEKQDEKVLAATRVSSGILPITADSYLKSTKGGYLIFHKPPGKKVVQVGTVALLKGKLKMTAKITNSTAIEIRKRLPAPQNTFLVTLNGRIIAKATGPAKNPPPPVSPFVPPTAPPVAVASDYSTNKTPTSVQKEITPPPPKSVAPKTLPPDPHSPSGPVVTVNPATGRKVMTFPPEVITAEKSVLAELPDIEESETFLERFFSQEAISGVGFKDVVPEITFDLREKNVPQLLQFEGAPPRVEILSGHDEMDDADEELAEMQESGFMKGWW